MNKLKKILIIFFITFGILKSDILSPDISFLDLPVSGKVASLGNTYLSDISNPSNLLLNPSNIWFGDKVNSSPNTLFRNIFHRFSLSNFKIINDDSQTNIMYSMQYGNLFTLGLGYIENIRFNIDQYDENANFLGEISYQEKAVITGFATQMAGINLGASTALINNSFYGNNLDKSNDIYLLSVGLSMNEKYIKIKRKNFNYNFVEILTYAVPYRLSMHLNSKNVFYENSSSSTLYNNIVGLKLDYFFNKDGNNRIKKNMIYFLFDFKSNNGITSDELNFGLGYERFINDMSFNFNCGIKKIDNFEGFSYGIEYKGNNPDLNFSLANVSTPWQKDYLVLTFSYLYKK